MSNRVSISFKENAVDIMNEGGQTRLGRVQRFEMNSNLPNTVINELGSNKQVGRIFDLAEVSATVSSIDVGARTVFHMAGLNWASAPSGTMIEAQDIGYVCLVQKFKSRASDDIARTLVVPGAKLDSISLNYSVSGDATEDFSFQGTTRTWLRYDAALVSGVVSAGDLAFSGARQLKDGSYFLALFDENGFLPKETATASSASSVTVGTAYNGQTLFAVIHRDETNEWDYTWEEVPTTMPVGVRGWGVELYLVKTGETDTKIYRAQNFTLNAQFPTQRVMELGNEEVVGYSDQIPEVTGTLEIMLHDFKLLEQLSDDDDSLEDNWTPQDLSGGGWGIEARLWRRGADRLTTEPEKVVWVPELEMTQDSNNSQVNQDAMQTFNWASKNGNVYFSKGFRDV